MLDSKLEPGESTPAESGNSNGHASRRGLATSDASFWDALQADEEEDEGGPSSSRPPTPPRGSGPSSRSQSAGLGPRDEDTPRRAGGRVKKEKEAFAPPLIDQLPQAWDEAHETFEVLERCVYETKKLGLSREQDEMMVCDCIFDRSE